MPKMESRPARIATQSVAGGEKTKEQLQEELRKTQEELAIQKWGIEKTLEGMKVMVSEIIQKGKGVEEEKAKIETANEKLESLDRLKDEFLSVASHELRTPLTAIDGLVSMILEGEYGEVNKDLKQPLEDVNTSSERLIHLVNDLLNLSRLQAGRLKYTFSQTDIKPIVEGIVKMMQVIAEPKGLKLSAPNINSIIVSADIGKVEEILDNLIGNSLKFTDKGSIVLSTKVVEDKVIIFITDTGIGIGKEDLEKLFGRFEKLESGLGRPAGTGLGLHISREMARKMGGDVWLEKSEKGMGSTFAFSIPRSNSELARKARGEIEKEAKVHPDQKSVS